MRKRVASRKDLVEILQKTNGKFISIKFKKMQEFGTHDSVSLSCRVGVKRPKNDNFAVHAVRLFDPEDKLVTVFDTNARYRNRKFKGDYRSFYLKDIEEIKFKNTIIVIE